MPEVINRIGFALFLSFFLMSNAVLAQTDGTDGTDTTATTEDNEIEAKGVGIAGGIIAGAEVVLAIESIAKVKPTWAWWVFPVVGATGGGIGGYFIEKNSTGGAIALLVTSMVAIIPTAIGVATARSFNPDITNAKEGDNPSVDGSFSFEQEPTGEISNQEEAVTEVEARPEGVVPAGDTTGPPAPETPATEEEIPADEVKPEATLTPEMFEESRKQEKLAHLQSGALLHMNRNLHLGMGIPAVDVAPTSIVDNDLSINKQGLAVHIPLLKIDLP